MQQFVNTALSGLTLGAVYAAFALALVLIFRSTRIVNFAQAPMAMVTTFIALEIIDAGYSYWIGFAAALLCGLVLGAVLERVVIRPVENKPDINAVILTLGLFITLHALASVIFGNTFRSFPAPFGLRGLEVGGTTIALTTSGIFTVGAVATVMLLLVGLFRYTDIGLQMRASAYNAEVARLLGVRVGRMLTLGWALAAVVGSLAGLLIANGGLVHPGYMDSVVVYGFVAAVLGGLESPGGAVVGGLLLGLSLSFVSGYLGSQLVRAGGAADPDAGADPQARRPVRRGRGEEGLMGRVLTWWRASVLGRHLLTAFVGLLLLVVVLESVGDYRALQLAAMAYLAIAAGGLTVLTGVNGQISLGHGALMAFGAYTTALMLNEPGNTLPITLVVAVAVLVTLAVGTAVGVAAARLHGPYLAGATLALAVAVPGIALHFSDTLGGEQGLRVSLPAVPTWALDLEYFLTGTEMSRSQYVGYLAWITLIVTFVLLANLVRGRVGRRWRAVRDDEVAAELSGIRLGRSRISAFMVSAAAAGAAGAMLAITARLAAPSGFTLVLSLTLLTAVVLGGLGSLFGALVGAALLTFLPPFVTRIGGDAGLSDIRAAELAPLVYGLVMVLVILLAPAGIVGTARMAWLGRRARRPLTGHSQGATAGGPDASTPGSEASVSTTSKGNTR